jgi:hypothetical protein
MSVRQLAGALCLACLSVGPAQAGLIEKSQIIPSTTLLPFTFGKTFVISEINDGIVSDAAPFNGFAANYTLKGRITLGLDAVYDITSFLLHNDINIQAQGVRSFTLTFQDVLGNDILKTDTLFASSRFEPFEYTFGAGVKGVKTVQLDVLTSLFQIEIREVQFNGTAVSAPIPEPGTWALMAAGLAGVGARLRRRAA